MTIRLLAALGGAALVACASPALADFSACDSALRTNDPKQQVDLYTICITKSGLTGAERAGAFNNRGLAYVRTGEDEKAFQDFTWSIEADPRWGTAYVNRGFMYQKRGDWAHAIADFDTAGGLSPVEGRAPALQAEARLLAMSPDPAIRNPKRAIEVAQKALKLQKGAPEHDALAIAYAADGQFDAAAQEEAKAIELASKPPSPGGLAEMKARLEAFQKRATGPAG
jgi:tetratricopeptide (TPR) repeat protein